MKLLDCFPMLFAFEYFVACFGDCGSSIPYGKIFFQVNLFFPLLMISTLSPVLDLFQRAKGSTSVVAPVQTCSKVTNSTPSLFPIANDHNPYLLFMYLFQRAKGSTSKITPIQTCSKLTNSTLSLFPIANDLNPYLLFLYLFQRAKGSTSEVTLVQIYSKVTNLTPLFP
jgi:hypothetical protein